MALQDLARARARLAKNEPVAEKVGDARGSPPGRGDRQVRLAREERALEGLTIKIALYQREVDLAGIDERNQLGRVARAHEDVLAWVPCEVLC